MDFETLSPEQQAYIRMLNNRRSNLLAELAHLDASLHSAAKQAASFKPTLQLVRACSCGKTFLSSDFLQHHLCDKHPANEEHYKAAEYLEPLPEVNFKPLNPAYIRKFRCFCGQEFDSFLDRLLHFDSVGFAEIKDHGDAGELHNGKIVVRDTRTVGEPIIARQRTSRALDNFDNIE